MAAPRLVSVVVPVRNERRHLPDQLAALAVQDYAGAWEVVVVDDGSSDGSAEVARSFADRLPGLRVVALPRRGGLNHARNTGVAAASGEVVAFCDADDVAAPGWLAGLVRALDDDADVVGGHLDLETLNGELQRSWRNKRPWIEKRLANGFLEYVPGGNCALRTEVARELRWDESFLFGSSDAEFSWRAQHLGLRIALADDAVVAVRFPETLGELARQFYGYGSGEPLLFRRERGSGWPRSDTRAALREWGWIVVHLPDLVRSPQRRGWWVRVAAQRAGRLRGSLRARVLYL